MTAEEKWWDDRSNVAELVAHLLHAGRTTEAVDAVEEPWNFEDERAEMLREAEGIGRE